MRRYTGQLVISIFDADTGAWLPRVLLPECDQPLEAPAARFCQDEAWAVAQGAPLCLSMSLPRIFVRCCWSLGCCSTRSTTSACLACPLT